MVIGVLSELGGVAVPVAAGVVDPVDGCGGGDAEQVSKDRGGELGGEVSRTGELRGRGGTPIFRI